MRVVVPPHISGIWCVVRKDDLLKSGSLGVGVTLAPPLIIEPLGSGKDYIVMGNESVNLSTVTYALEEMLRLPKDRVIAVRVKAKECLKIGYGYGLSAAITLGAVAINMVLNKDLMISKGFKVSLNEAGKVAHISEIVNQTGYGDLMAEMHGGGLVVRVKEGGPGYGVVDKVPVSSSIRVITAHLKRPKHTKVMLNEMGRRGIELGLKYFNEFMKDPSIETFSRLAHDFSLETGLMTLEEDLKIKESLRDLLSSSGVLGYFIKKSLLVVVAEEQVVNDVTYALLKNFGHAYVFNLYFGSTYMVV